MADVTTVILNLTQTLMLLPIVYFAMKGCLRDEGVPYVDGVEPEDLNREEP